jgi:hypothetical protein
MKTKPTLAALRRTFPLLRCSPCKSVFCGIGILISALALLVVRIDAAETNPSAAARLLEPGPEMTSLQARTGDWDVTATFRASPDAKAIEAKGIVAHREMVGPYLLEVMKPVPNSETPAFRRDAYLTYNRVEGRWQYVSIDTRFPVGIMPAYGFGKGEKDKPLVLVFEPIAFVGMGPTVEGRMVRSNLVITRKSEDHEVIQQFFIASDGTEREWLATQYEYKRQKK